MKRLWLLTTLLAVMAGSASAQAKSLETWTANGLIFGTGASSPTTERMRITQGGLLAIGTQSPTATLHVSGSMIVSVTGQNGSNPSFYVGTNGYVGAGTAGPDSPLTVSGSATGPFTGTGAMTMTVKGGAASGTWRGIDFRAQNSWPMGRIALEQTGAGSFLSLGTSNNYSAGITNQALTINPAGKIGVLNTAPLANLDVMGTISASDAIQVSGSSLTCSSAIKGAIRFSSVSNTLEYCTSVAWTAVGNSSDSSLTAFTVTKSSTQALATAGTVVTWDAAVTNNGNAFNLTTERFTAPATGLYYFHASLMTNSDNSSGDFKIYKNGTGTGLRSYGAYTTTDYKPAAAQGVLYLIAGDYVDVRANAATQTLYGSANESITTFSGFLLNTGTGGSGGGSANPAGGAGDIQFNDGSNLAADTGQLFWDAANNRLGIGTGSPGYALEVNGDVAAAALTARSLTSTHANGLIFGTAASSPTAERMRITQDGLIGIGIQNPTQILEISPTVGNTTAIKLNYANLYMLQRANEFSAYNGPLHLQYGSTSNTLINALGGKVGVGNLAPIAKLDVVGTISASDAIQVSGSSLTCGTHLAGAIRYESVSNTIQVCAGASGWKSLVSGTAGATSLATLTDTTITNVAGRDYLRYDNVAGKWKNVSESTVMSTTTMVPGWPDAITCTVTNPAVGVAILYAVYSPYTNGLRYYRQQDISTYYGITFGSSGAYSGTEGWTTTNCNGKSIAQLYADGQAFNFIGNAASGSSALGDRITSGTLAMTGNSATSVVSLSTGATTWGYLGAGASYLPQLTAGQVSASNISSTYIQIQSATTVLACGTNLTGTMRYTSGTMQVCNGSSWGNIGIGVPTGTIAAFAASSCPSGWSEYTAGRGRFLRGIDNSAGNDPEGTRSPGATQADAFQGHWHEFKRNTSSTHGAGSPYESWTGTNSSSPAYTSGVVNVPTTDGVSGAPRTSSETRPKNVAVTFCQFNGFQSQLQTGVATLASLSDVSVGGASNGQALVYNGSSWVPSTTTSGATPAGSTGDIQFNSSGALEADTGQLFWDGTNNWLGVGTGTPASTLDVAGMARIQSGLEMGATGGIQGWNVYYNSGWRYRGGDAGYLWRNNGSTLTLQAAPTGLANGTVSTLVNALSIASDGKVGIGAASPVAKLDVAGNVSVTGGVSVTGSVEAFAFMHPSDVRLKKDIRTVADASTILENLRGTHFTWKANGHMAYGVIAQEVENILPELVAAGDGPKTVDYDQFTPILIEGWKAQQKTIGELKAANETLEAANDNQEKAIDALEQRIRKLEAGGARR